MHQRRRIVLLFGLGIVLPSVLLGYLAFRGVQNDRALVEKERTEETRRTADRVLAAVDDRIAAAESAFSKIALDSKGTPSPEMVTALERWAAENPLVEQFFYLQDYQDFHFPVAKLLYVPDGSREAGLTSAGFAGDPADLRAAEQLEFRQRDYPGAASAYRQTLKRSKDAGLDGRILNALARVQRKSGLLSEAVSTYEGILREHGHVVMPGGMPLGPSAALEIGSLSRELGDSAKSLRASLGLYRALIRPEWTLEKGEFEFFVGRVKGLIQELFADGAPGLDLEPFRTEFRSLGDAEVESQRRTERVLRFESGAATALKPSATLSTGQEGEDPPFARLILEAGGFPYLVSIRKPTAGTDVGTGRIWGLIFDAERLRENVLRPALSGLFPSGEVCWIVRGRDGAILLSSERAPSGPVTLRTNFVSNFPDWALEIQQPPPRLIKTFLLSRRGLYSFVFLLIAGILVFGLILTLRSVSHELELARMKSDFVSTVSHEFKSPLTSIRQLAEMLQSGRVPSEERRQKYYDVLLEQSERLALLTDNILSLAKSENGRAELRLEPTDIAALLADVTDPIRERVRHEGFMIGFEVEGTLPPVAADRTALAQAVTNLIDNAVKYSGESRTISVRAFSEGPSVIIAVQDRGIGIKREDLDRVFERFYRAGDELTRTVKGSGLGLALVKEIVEAHQGVVSVESEPGKGSVFAIRLPATPGGGS